MTLFMIHELLLKLLENNILIFNDSILLLYTYVFSVLQLKDFLVPWHHPMRGYNTDTIKRKDSRVEKSKLISCTGQLVDTHHQKLPPKTRAPKYRWMHLKNLSCIYHFQLIQSSVKMIIIFSVNILYYLCIIWQIK